MVRRNGTSFLHTVWLRFFNVVLRISLEKTCGILQDFRRLSYFWDRTRFPKSCPILHAIVRCGLQSDVSDQLDKKEWKAVGCFLLQILNAKQITRPSCTTMWCRERFCCPWNIFSTSFAGRKKCAITAAHNLRLNGTHLIWSHGHSIFAHVFFKIETWN